MYTILSPKFVSAAHTVTILSQFASVADAASSLTLLIVRSGIIPFKIVYLFFINPITRSTCIRTEDIFLDISTSFADNCDLPLVKAGVKS